MWEHAITANRSEQARWVAAADFEARRGNLDHARALYADGAARRLDYPEYLLDAWLTFEHQYGDLQSIEEAMERIRKYMGAITIRRQKEYAEAQAAAAAQAAEAPSTAAPMDVDAPVAGSSAGLKRAAGSEEPAGADERAGKRAKTEHEPAAAAAVAAPTKPDLKRDRENSSVLITPLAPGTTEADLKRFFAEVRANFARTC